MGLTPELDDVDVMLPDATDMADVDAVLLDPECVDDVDAMFLDSAEAWRMECLSLETLLEGEEGLNP